MTYLLSKGAERDLREIWNYTFEKWEKDQAGSYLKGIDKSLNQIVSSSKIGRLNHRLGSNVRVYKYKRELLQEESKKI